MINFADDIKERVTMSEICSAYGISVNRHGKALCPFHNDTHASMQIYDKTGGWWCFTCGTGGDVIDFVERFFGLDFQGACGKINDDLRLGLSIGREMSLREYRDAQRSAAERKKRLEQKKAEHAKLLKEYDEALEQYVFLDRQRLEYSPERMNGFFCDFYVDAIKNIPAAEDALNTAEMRLYQYEHNRQ